MGRLDLKEAVSLQPEVGRLSREEEAGRLVQSEEVEHRRADRRPHLEEGDVLDRLVEDARRSQADEQVHLDREADLAHLAGEQLLPVEVGCLVLLVVWLPRSAAVGLPSADEPHQVHLADGDRSSSALRRTPGGVRSQTER